MAGFSKAYSKQNMNEVPEQWRDFDIRIAPISAPVGFAAYGVSYGRSDDQSGFAYIAGVEVDDSSIVPDDFDQLQIPAGTFAVFPHDDHVSQLTGTIHKIWSEWLPQSGHQFDDRGEGTVYQIERYGREFDPKSGQGGMEVWFPIKS